MKKKVSIFWFRRDLRLKDNVGLANALKGGSQVLPIFIFDPTILNQLEDKTDRRVDYIQQALHHLNQQLEKKGSSLRCFYTNPIQAFTQLLEQYEIDTVYCNIDYEPYALKRDLEVQSFLGDQSVSFHSYKDQVIFEGSDILKQDGKPYTVFTPYSRKWLEKVNEKMLLPQEMNWERLVQIQAQKIIPLSELGFNKTEIKFTVPVLDSSIIDAYEQCRDYPSLDQTTHLGIAFRFGTLSIREAVAFALDHNQIWLKELIWREFFMQILYHFPQVEQQSFKPKYDHIPWLNKEADFELWCSGNTGYPLVDAGMRQLNQTGFMHNRVRMLVASFLCKHLLIDWRWGEAYFAKKLDDFDLASNNGNWQWAAGSGCDAAPYFRIFNPNIQLKKFDKENLYVKKWVPEYGTDQYPTPIVNHEEARKRALAVYAGALS
ncbi:cryptochrome/photolyase family protein [Sphingobacterium lactis]|uniref:cryptochrome/photolyase family protein n=1 Tax=Sphingobacterium lactis TaxID=797291 RepID=UPI003F7F2A22